MEPTPAATPVAPTAIPAPVAASSPVLPRYYLWGAVAVAAALPFVLLVTLIAILASSNYNFLNWLE